MAASTVTERYDATPEAAWALVGDFPGIGDVFPGIEDVVVEDARRTFTLTGMRMTEQLVARDDATMSITYSIVDGLPLEAHETTVTVAPAEAGCEVTFRVATVPEEAQPLFIDSYQRALEHLHTRLDAS